MDKASEEIRKAELVRVVSHLDADGISAASVAVSFLSRLGKKVHVSTRKQISPGLVDDLKKEESDLFLFTDLGSGYMKLMEELAESTGSKIIICDHHMPSPGGNENIIHINPILDGKSEDEVSGAGVVYQLAKKADPKNTDLSFLALIGAIGDMQDDSWEMVGINKLIADESLGTGVVKREKGTVIFGRMDRPVHKALEYSTTPFIPGISGDGPASLQFLGSLGIGMKKEGEWRTLADLESGEMEKLARAVACEKINGKDPCPGEIFGQIYSMNVGGEVFDAREMATSLNACGRMEQASTGILSVLGLWPVSRLEGIIAGYRKMITRYMKWVGNSKKVKKTEKACYIMAGEEIHENFIGTITSICQKSSVFGGENVVFGISDTPNGKSKVSVRAPEDLVEKGLNLKDMLEKVTEGMEGYGGGHASAAGAFIPKGKEKEFIDACETYLKEKL